MEGRNQSQQEHPLAGCIRVPMNPDSIPYAHKLLKGSYEPYTCRIMGFKKRSRQLKYQREHSSVSHKKSKAIEKAVSEGKFDLAKQIGIKRPATIMREISQGKLSPVTRYILGMQQRPQSNKRSARRRR